jgi:hypothetical protein
MNRYVNSCLALMIGSLPALTCFAQSHGQSANQAKLPPSKYNATIEGLVRDVACPVQNHKSTATDFDLDCALACAKAGSPLIILTKDGDIFFSISDQMPDSSQREKLMPFVGKYVRARGMIYTRNGTQTIVIKEMTELKNVHLKPGAASE